MVPVVCKNVPAFNNDVRLVYKDVPSFYNCCPDCL